MRSSVRYPWHFFTQRSCKIGIKRRSVIFFFNSRSLQRNPTKQAFDLTVRDFHTATRHPAIRHLRRSHKTVTQLKEKNRGSAFHCVFIEGGILLGLLHASHSLSVLVIQGNVLLFCMKNTDMEWAGKKSTQQSSGYGGSSKGKNETFLRGGGSM